MNKKSEDTITKMFNEANKIWPAKSAIPILLVFFLISVSIMIGSLILDKKEQKIHYLDFQINGQIDSCVDSKKYKFLRINNSWFGVQGAINKHIETNDSILKFKGSFELFVISPTGEKNKYHYPNTYFWLVERKPELKKVFKTHFNQ